MVPEHQMSPSQSPIGVADSRLRVLLLDDDDRGRQSLARYLNNTFGYSIDAVASGQEALERVASADGRYDVAILDALLPERPDGIEVLELIKGRYPDMECIIFTGYRDEEAKRRALQCGAFRHLQKGFDPGELGLLIRMAGQQVRLREIGRAILSMHDLGQILDAVADGACSLALAEEASIALMDAQTGRIRIHTHNMRQGPSFRTHLRKLQLSRQIIQSGQVERVLDTTDPRVSEGIRRAQIASFVGLPIPGEKGNLGVLYVYSCKQTCFEEWSTIAILQTLASQAGLAIANADAYERVREHASQMIALAEVGRQLTRETALDRQLDLVWDFARQTLRATTFFVAQYDAREDMITFPLAYDGGKPVKVEGRVLGQDRLRWGLAGLVARTGEEHGWQTPEEAQQLSAEGGIQPFLPGEQFASGLGVPLKAENSVLGVIAVQSAQPHAFSSSTQDTFRALANQLATAMENARLHREARAMRSYIQSLQEASNAIIASGDPLGVLQRVVDSLCKITRGSRATVVLANENRRLQHAVSSGFNEKIEQLTVREPSISISQQVYDSGNPRFYSDVDEVKSIVHPDLVARRCRSAACLALELEGKSIGVLWMEFMRPQQFPEEMQQALRTYANQAAIAYSSARHMRELEGVRRTLALMGDAIATEADRTAFHIIVEETSRLLHSDAVVLYSYDALRGEIQDDPVAMVGLRQEDKVRGRAPSWKDTALGRVLGLNRTHYAENAPDDETMRGRFVAEEEIQSSVAVLLRFQGDLVGVLFINYRTRHTFTESEQETIDLFANYAAVAMRNAQLLERLRGQVKVLSALDETTRAISSSLVLDERLKTITRLACELCDLEREPSSVGYLALCENDRLTLRAWHPDLGASEGRDIDRVRSISLLDGHNGRIGIVGRAIRDRATQSVDDVSADPDYIPIDPRVRSTLAVPIMSGDMAIGGIVVEHHQMAAFSRQDRAHLESLAAHALLGIRNAQQYEELEASRGLLGATTAVVWMGLVGSVWSHSVRNKLRTISGQIRLARGDLQSDLMVALQLEQRLDVIERAVAEIRGRPMIPPLSPDVGTESIPLYDVISERFEGWRQNADCSAITWRVDLQLAKTAVTRANKLWLGQALDIVVDNAAKAASKGQRKEVSILARASAEGKAELYIHDTGPGIPADIHDKLFKHHIPSQEGSGVGLMLAFAIVSAYRGTIRLEPSGTEGTTIKITLPLQ